MTLLVCYIVRHSMKSPREIKVDWRSIQARSFLALFGSAFTHLKSKIRNKPTFHMCKIHSFNQIKDAHCNTYCYLLCTHCRIKQSINEIFFSFQRMHLNYSFFYSSYHELASLNCRALLLLLVLLLYLEPLLYNIKLM